MSCIVAAVSLVVVLGIGSARASATTLPSGFQETTVISGLTNPTAIRFSPDGRVFVAEKRGIVKVFDSITDTTPEIYVDLRTKVHSYNDRGLLGLALDPSFPTVQDIYVSYAHDAPIGGTAPVWGQPNADSDDCPTPPGPNLDGCVISGRLSRIRPAAGSGTPYDQAVLVDTPSAYWRLGEASGTSAADSSGGNRPGSYVDTPSFGQPGALAGSANTSVGFDGVSEHVQVPYAAGLNPATFTVEAWAYVTGGQGRFRAVVSNRDYATGNARGFILYAAPDNTWQFWIGNGGADWARAYGPAVALNTWTHLVGTYDGTTMRFYVNGVLAATTTSTYGVNTARPLRIGAGANERPADYLFAGRIDEAAVYSGALSATRVQQHYSAGTTTGGQTGGVAETVLVEDWCQQYPTGSVGDIDFGSDGALYMLGGGGGSFTFNDWGQGGSPPNPCGDPPGGVGASLTPPTAEGGWLRSQDLRTSGDPVGLSGTLIRVDKNTGAGLPDNPLASSSDANARRIVSYGFRNPYRMAIRPGTRDVWIGDVGAGIAEEIDRVTDPADATVENFGWPCYEGGIRQPGYDAANLNICENLYAAGAGAVTAPFYYYEHGSRVVSTDTCAMSQGSATSGLAFAPAGGGAYPTTLGGALFFADYARQCIWYMRANASGIPDPATRTVFATDAAFPVDLEFGPDGRLYYVDVGIDDVGGGTIRRIDYFAGNQPPIAVATASPTSGPAPLTVNFDGSGSSDPDGTITAYAWDLDGDGQFDDSTAQKPSFTYTTGGNRIVRLRVTDNQTVQTVSAPITISVGNNAPTAIVDAPASTFTWRANQSISFTGHGTDPEDGTVPASRMSWDVVLRHCITPTDCHSHLVQTFSGVASGTFAAPDHEYPSFIELRLTVTDSGGLANTTVLRLDPKTVNLTMQSSPSGLTLVVNSQTGTTPFTYVAVEGATTTISATTPQSLGGQSYAFSSWSDGGAQTHTLTATASATFTATYTAGAPPPGYSAAVLADSPTAYWRLGESSGVTAADVRGSFPGTYVATPSLGQSGALSGDANTAVGFDGVAEHVTVPYAAALNGTRFTVEAWAYVTGGAGRYRAVASNRDYAPGNTRGWILYAGTDDAWQFWMGDGSGGWRRTIGPAVQLNTWTHLVGTYDGTTGRFYVNGTLVGSSTNGYALNTARPLRIGAGRNESAADYLYPGRIDEVAVYPGVLSQARVQVHYAAATGGGGGTNQPPVAVASASPTSGPAPLTVSFNGSGSSDPDGSIGSYAWDLDGDGQFDDSTAQSPQFTYTTAGTRTVKLRVTDNQGAPDDSDPLTITVNSATNQPPVAVASASPTSGTAPLTVSFSGAGSSDPDGSIASYAWDLDGDGQFDDSTAQGPQFTYTTAATVTVKLRVTDNQGAPDDSDPLTITVTGGTLPGYAQSVLTDSPLAYWRLGESTGTVAADASGGGRPGTYVSTPTLGQPGALIGDPNTAVGFDGVTEHVTVPYAAALNGGQFTVEAWAYVTGGSGLYRAVVSNRDYVSPVSRGWILYAAPDNTWQFWLGDGASSWTRVFGPAVQLNTWTHLVGTFDGTTARFYVNGTLVSSTTSSTFVANPSRPLRIAAGRNESPGDYWLPGRVDEAAVYAGALAGARVQAHYVASGR
jgi:PKD repeat protein/glucose/arabinose dehydrogenase